MKKPKPLNLKETDTITYQVGLHESGFVRLNFMMRGLLFPTVWRPDDAEGMAYALLKHGE
jgi:hypothetical protein